MGDGCLSVAEVAEYLRVHRATVDRLVARRELGHVRLGRRVVIRREDLLAYVSARLVPAAADARLGGGTRR